ncbi:hypothetical protein HWQ46_04880 [Shewanella sp. D64]|uniref:hypothetical protein n=1 Tax=unclassified Shewanella TaxID=196818 RepID=UPI0022BA1F96|nr:MULTISPECIES: hypothetical protein [unclassified Shewanella]MEC4724884.1 hypothetical protein [Shewanella sp. D64]MEC4736323.1 hypothetical protein [Shewanella sp. E94]WBJ97616.1 hypothetical protein HWQ47_11250 [Shewanella sp. MTB7]
MFEPLLTQPEIITIDKRCRLKVSLHESTADFCLLQVMSGHIGEFIVVSITPDALSIMVRLHPFLSVNVESYPLDEHKALSVLSRGVGQGWRLFPGLGVSPIMCAQDLKAGVDITVSFTEHADVALENEPQWQLVPLEKDRRLFHGPKELLIAEALVAKDVSYELSSQQLLLEICDVENVRRKLLRFSVSAEVCGHPELNDKISDIDAQLIKKKQWLSQRYHHSVERLNWQTSANHEQKHDLQSRQLEYYRLLSTTAINEMVQQLIKDED